MTEAARNDLDTRLHDYEKQTKHQVWVYIIATSKPDLTSEWCKRAFNAWGVGREGLDDGLVLFVFSRDHVTRVELGYGFEAAISDQEATRVATKIEARIRKGQPDEAISQGIQELIADIDKWEMKQ